MKPTPNDITRALNSIEVAELAENHPRRLAREAIARFRSNAQRDRLPITNIHDDKGAPVLDVDSALK